VGRADLLRRREGIAPTVDLSGLLRVGRESQESRKAQVGREAHVIRKGTSSDLLDTISPAHPLTVTGTIANTDRAFGAAIAGAIAARFGDAGLPDGSVQMAMAGSAGQSFGAFALPGMRLALVGDANDGLGKGMHGG